MKSHRAHEYVASYNLHSYILTEVTGQTAYLTGQTGIFFSFLLVTGQTSKDQSVIYRSAKRSLIYMSCQSVLNQTAGWDEHDRI
jgi:hypothetical protein